MLIVPKIVVANLKVIENCKIRNLESTLRKRCNSNERIINLAFLKLPYKFRIDIRIIS